MTLSKANAYRCVDALSCRACPLRHCFAMPPLPKGEALAGRKAQKTPFRSGNSVRGFSFALASTMSTLISYVFIICHSPQKSSIAQKVYRNRRAAAFHFFQSCVSFRIPNSLRSKPLRPLGLLRTTTCIEPTTFRRLIRHYRRSAPGMFRFSSGSARLAPSPPPPVRPFGWRW